MLESLVGLCIIWLDSSKDPFIFQSCSRRAVHCSKILWINGFSDFCLWSIETSLHTCLSQYLVDLCCISRCGVVIIFFCMFFPLVYRSVYWHFVCTITRWECKGGKSCSSIIIFMWSKQWEGALLWCTNLVIVSWLTETGFYMMLQEEEDWRVFQGSVQSNYIKIYFLTYILWLTTCRQTWINLLRFWDSLLWYFYLSHNTMGMKPPSIP